jgi:hypothetical protein
MATSTMVKISEVLTNPTPRSTLIQSAKLSPTVVHKILMTQNQIVTSGTLLSNARAVDDAPDRGDVVGMDMSRMMPCVAEPPVTVRFALGKLAER